MDREEESILINADRSEEKPRRFILESALLLFFFGWDLAGQVLTNELLKQTCLTFGYNVTDCSNLNVNNETKKMEEEIQPHVAKIIMTIRLMNSIIPAALSLFFGPWSDKYGRRKIICAAFVGFAVTLIALTVINFTADRLPKVNPWIYLLAYIPAIATGGWSTLFMTSLCYISDLSDDKTRSTRITIIESILFIAILCGTGSSSFILKLTSPTAVFLISACCATFSATITIFFLDESLPNITEASKCEQLTKLLSPVSVIEMLKTCLQPRPDGERKILWCLIAILLLTVIPGGTDNVFYLFVRLKFSWTLKDETTFHAITLLITTCGCFIGIGLFKKLLKFSDIFVATISFISMLANSLLLAFAETPSQLYIASGVAVFKFLYSPMCRSLVTQIIPKNEIGKFFSFISSLEAMSSFIASPLYTFVYTNTLVVFAGAFFFISTITNFMNLLIIFCVARMKKTRESG